MPNLVEPAPDATAEEMPQAAPAASLVPPTDQEAPAQPEAVPGQQDAEEGTPMPEELMKIPAFQALMAGSPPALSYDLDDKADRPERKVAEDNIGYLQEAGMGIYRTLDKQRGVIYNGLRIHPDDLAAADRAGKLKLIAPDFDAVNHAVGKAGDSHPAFHVGSVPNGPASSRSATIAPQSATQQAIADRISGAPGAITQAPPIVAPASAGAQRKVAQARAANMKPTSPTGGAAPGGGALLNAIMKPVV